MMRWSATINYRTEHGVVDVEHDISEIRDLHDIVENGPHWDTVVNITINRIGKNVDPTLTVEKARTQ